MKGVIVDYNYMGAYYGAAISVCTRNNAGLVLHALLPGKMAISLGLGHTRISSIFKLIIPFSCDLRQK